jgi:CxxC motif-containing protein (DUF1111 family)
VLQSISDVTGFSAFMRFLAPPQPAPDNPSIVNGRQLFGQIGCTACHTSALTTGNALSPALRNQQAHLYSDLLVHAMGDGLADGVTQGNAHGNEWRTAPFGEWGNGCFSCTTDGRPIRSRRSGHNPVPVPKPMPWWRLIMRCRQLRGRTFRIF